MGLHTEAAMVLFYDIAGEAADHDDWHSFQHMHERLAVPGFQRATRWVARGAGPRYLVIYEVAGVEVGASAAYLARLNDPTPWTASLMGRFRGMARGFCSVAAGAGYGLGHAALAVRFTPGAGWKDDEDDAAGRLAALVARRGMASAHLLRPAPPPPMTKEQALRGPDAPIGWVLFATGYEAAAVERALPEALAWPGVGAQASAGAYALHFTATAEEVARTPARGQGPRPR